MSELIRYFTSYTGRALPLTPIGPLDESDIRNRNTFIRAAYDGEGRLVLCEKLVYGEIEMAHRYSYHPGGALMEAEVTNADEDEETVVLRFDEGGTALP